MVIVGKRCSLMWLRKGRDRFFEFYVVNLGPTDSDPNYCLMIEIDDPGASGNHKTDYFNKWLYELDLE
jgi:hypothetical protein